MDAPKGLIATRNLSVSFNGIDVLKNVDIDLFGGAVHSIVGENGAGKSTLAKAMAGVNQPRTGSVYLDGRKVSFANPKMALQNRVALIHQEPQTFPDLNVTENIFAGHHRKRGLFVDWRATYREAERILETLGLNLDPDAEVGGLSVADQQMVELASAMSHQARVWIFDETTAPLMPKEVGELFAVIRKLQDQGCAIGFVSHHLNEVFEISDQITVLRDGERVESQPTRALDPDRVVQLMVGRELSKESLRAQKAPQADRALEVKSGAGPGFAGVNLHVSSGEVVGLVGLVGAGRTELARSLFGITQFATGQVTVQGRSVTPKSPQSAIASGIALIPEDRQHDGLHLDLSISFNSTLAFLPHLNKLGWLKDSSLAPRSEAFAAKLHLARASLDQPARELSGGNQQKVVLAKWLMTNSKVLILDEPTRGIDVGAKHEVHKLIRSQADSGVAVLMISSDLQEALTLSDRLYVMRAGTIVAEFKGSEATQEAIMFAATGQEEARNR